MCACDNAKNLQQNCAFHLCSGVSRLVADCVSVSLSPSLSLPVFVSLCLCVCLFDSFALARACKLCALSPRWCLAVAVVAAFCGKSLAVVPFRLSASKLISCNCVGVRTWPASLPLSLSLCLCWPLVAVCCHQFMRIYYNIYACKLCDAPRINYTPGSKST